MNLWNAKICASLILDMIGFQVSEFDSCIFLHNNCLICLYINDTILHVHNEKIPEKILKQINDAGYALSRDEDFGYYLGVMVGH